MSVHDQLHQESQDNEKLWFTMKQLEHKSIRQICCNTRSVKEIRSKKWFWEQHQRVKRANMQPDILCFLTLLFLFLSPPKNFPIWSRRPGFFFLRPRPKAACAELLADAIVVRVVVGSSCCMCTSGVLASLLNERVEIRGGKRENKRREGQK